ncbi:hypothetical protein P280DRAFT_485347 [Massarina eburnea CBS 473.64]|uniref:Palmitoyltransferase n=1 Tax=Massarina eburnea CBS 473.64 TaxID=1395130 RepID=A0A6A6RHH4_9PLEO|nr:hypothetical protein P280DRAFT_485347 [Massarina eburnea CBS 473.64]
MAGWFLKTLKFLELWGLPFLLVVQAFLPPALIFGRLLPHLLSKTYHVADGDDEHWVNEVPPEDRRHGVTAAILISVFFAVTFLLWVPAVVYALWSWHVTARFRPLDNPPRVADTMQVQKAGDKKRRFCGLCNVTKGDRTYHSKQLGRCIPFHDHVCLWWAGGVWLENVKAYLVFVVFLTLYQVYCTVVAIWVLSIPDNRNSNPHIALGVLSGAMAIYSFLIAMRYWFSLVACNALEFDTLAPERYIWVNGRTYTWHTKRMEESPWNLGWSKNFRLIIGPWWSLPFFWTTTPLMHAAGQSPLRDGLLLPPIPLQNLAPSRRDEARSTGSDVGVDARRRSTLTPRHSSSRSD